MSHLLQECDGSQEVYELAMGELLELLDAPRLLILTGPGPVSEMRVRSSRGFTREGLWESGQLSLEILEQVVRDNQPLLLHDAAGDPELGERLSVLLSGLRSVICIPLKLSDGQLIGVLYADNPEQEGAFTPGDLGRVLLFLEQVEARLSRLRGVAPQPQALRATTPAGGRPDFGAPPEKKSTARPEELEPRRSKKEALVEGRPGAAGKVHFFRSLAVMNQAGVSQLKALEMLSQHSEDRVLRATAETLQSRLRRGHSLAQAMAPLSNIFNRLQIRMVRVGEQSGGLPRVLARLADYEERCLKLSQKLTSALTYPFFLALGCLAFLILGPPYLFADILALVEDYGMEPGWITWTLMRVSDLLAGPGIILLVTALAGLSLGLKHLFTKTRGGRYLFWREILKIPYLGPVFRASMVARFSQALALQLGAGVPLLKALPDAVRASDNPLLTAREEGATECLRSGQGIVAGLEHLNYLPSMFTAFAEVGVNTGTLDTMIEQLASHFETDLDHRLEVLVTVLEPLIMLVMGIMVGLILVGTLTPMLQLLQTL